MMDRSAPIEFHLIAHNGEREDDQRLLYQQAFNLSMTDARRLTTKARRMREHANDLVVRVTPEQFAAFLIRRHELQMKNGFAEIKARYVECEPEVMDLRKGWIQS